MYLQWKKTVYEERIFELFIISNDSISLPCSIADLLFEGLARARRLVRHMHVINGG